MEKKQFEIPTDVTLRNERQPGLPHVGVQPPTSVGCRFTEEEAIGLIVQFTQAFGGHIIPPAVMEIPEAVEPIVDTPVDDSPEPADEEITLVTDDPPAPDDESLTDLASEADEEITTEMAPETQEEPDVDDAS